jgi:hypothetical protein
MYKINRWIDIENSKDDNIWNNLSFNPNPNAIHLIEQNLDKLTSNCWWRLTRNPNAIHLLEKNPYKIDLGMLVRVPSMLDYDYEKIKTRCNIYKEQLIQKTMHPSRIQKYLDMGINIEELDNYL